MMHEAFFQAIRDAPEDDAARLVYADWLDEHGQSDRAEFIRAQVWLARMSEEDDRYADLMWRAEDLLAEHEAAWTEGLHGVVREWRFRRGFVEEIRIDVQGFLERTETLFRVAPLRHLILDARELEFHPELAERLAACPYLARLSGLTLGESGSSIDEAVRTLMTSPHLSGLTLLDLGAYEHGPGVAEAVANCPYLGQLKALYLCNCGRRVSTPIRTTGALALLTSPHLAALTALDLDDSMIDDEDLRLMAAAPQLARLKTLSAGDSWGTPEGVRALVESPYVTGLGELWLSANRLDSPSAEVLANAPHLANLTSLDLSYNRIGSAGMRALAASPRLAQLTRLDLRDTDLGAEGVRALANSPHLANLTALGLDHNNIGLAGLQALAASPYLRRLQVLDLGANFNTDSGGTAEDVGTGVERGRALAALPCLSRLTSLHLHGLHLGDDGLRVLLDSLRTNRLTSLNLGYNDLGADGMRCLAASPHLSRLRSLALHWNHIGDDGLTILGGASWLDGLRVLNLDDNGISKVGLEKLLSTPRAWRLTDLDLSGNVLGDAGAALLAGSPRCSRLKMLDLVANQISDAGAQALLTSPHLDRLTYLLLHVRHATRAEANRISETVARALEDRGWDQDPFALREPWWRAGAMARKP